jgi:RNA polymerase sigma-70 factor (ECF subfamily)
MTDEEAVRALRGDHKDALDALIERHELRALRLAYHITRDSESAKDVVADSFLAVVEQAGRYDPDRPFEPWFFRIVTNRAISATRWASRRQRLLSLIGPRSELADPEAQAVRNETQRALAQAMQSLPPKERAALALRYYLDLDERGIAEMLGWPLGTVKTRLHRGRAHLRQRLEAQDRGFWTANALEGD